MFLITAHSDYLAFNLFSLRCPEIDFTGNMRVLFFLNIHSQRLCEMISLEQTSFEPLRLKGYKTETTSPKQKNNIIPTAAWIISNKA